MKAAIARRWSRRDTALLLERIELYVSAGMAIDRVLALAREGMKDRQKESLQRVIGMVEAGGLLSEALSIHVRIAPALAGLIRHGESSSGLVEALRSGRSLIERQDELVKKCGSALAYPIVIAVFASLLTIGLVRGVMPQIIPMLESLHVELPLLTRIVIWLSRYLLAYGLPGGAISAACFVALMIAYRRKASVRGLCHAVLVRMPIVGSVISSSAVALFLRSYGSLVQSGITSRDAYIDTVATVSLVPLRDMLTAEIPSISRGKSIGTIFSTQRGYIPPYVGPLLSAGEASGTLGASAIRAADILDRDIEHMLKRLTALIEPVMMMAMGCFVGAIALSIMMPIYDISKVLQK